MRKNKTLKSFSDGSFFFSSVGFLQETIVKLQEEYLNLQPQGVGLDLATGEPTLPQDMGILDNYRSANGIMAFRSKLPCAGYDVMMGVGMKGNVNTRGEE